MEDLTFDQVMAETGLSKVQINRFVSLGSLEKTGDGRLTRTSVDNIKRLYELPPKRICPIPDRGYRK